MNALGRGIGLPFRRITGDVQPPVTEPPAYRFFLEQNTMYLTLF